MPCQRGTSPLQLFIDIQIGGPSVGTLQCSKKTRNLHFMRNFQLLTVLTK